MSNLKKKKLAILTAGGDCPGLNSVIASFTLAAINNGYEVTGIKGSFEGLLDTKHYINLDVQKISGIKHTGGTILGTANKGLFCSKAGNGETLQIPKEVLLKAKNNLDKEKIQALAVLGGDGSLNTAYQLSKVGVKIIGCPKTIDNDILGIDTTFGFSTAVDYINQAIERIHTTAESHGRIFIVETMGRSAGWLGLYGGISGGANAILIPEIPFDVKDIVKFLNKRHKKHGIIIVSEGAKAKDQVETILEVGTSKENRLGGIAKKLKREIDIITNGKIDIRTLVLGHLQRGGNPNWYDKILCTQYGVSAFNAIKDKNYNVVVNIKNKKIDYIPLEKIADGVKLVPANHPLINVAKDLGIFIGSF